MRFPILFLSISVAAASLLSAAPKPAAVQQLEKRIEEYVQLRERAASDFEANHTSKDPSLIEARRDALAAAIRSERHDAAVGNIFTPEVKAYLVSIIRREGKGDTKEATEDGNPSEEGKPVKLVVNGPYPENAPLSTMPPDLLLNLPKLPKDLEYRFVGRHLILYDSLAGMIVDYIPNAMRS